MITCDLCGKAKDCLQKEIEGKEYDICSLCWKLSTKAQGKGPSNSSEAVFLPRPEVVKEREKEREDDEPEPTGEPPKSMVRPEGKPL